MSFLAIDLCSLCEIFFFFSVPIHCWLGSAWIYHNCSEICCVVSCRHGNDDVGDVNNAETVRRPSRVCFDLPSHPVSPASAAYKPASPAAVELRSRSAASASSASVAGSSSLTPTDAQPSSVQQPVTRWSRTVDCVPVLLLPGWPHFLESPWKKLTTFPGPGKSLKTELGLGNFRI